MDQRLAADLFGLAASFAFVFACLGISALLLKRGAIGVPAARKLVHIGVAHWWLIAMAFIASPWIAAIGPALFIALNATALRRGPLEDRRDGNFGTVYYPVSLLVLTLLAWNGVLEAWQAGAGVLAMGWGDGLAALVGERVASPAGRVFGSRKSLAGSLAMFAASFAVVFALGWAYSGDPSAVLAARALSAALVATFLEAATPFGLDNLSVPLGTAFFCAYLSGAPAASPVPLGFAVTGAVAYLAYARRAVTFEGALAGVALGTALFVFGGVSALAVLFAFFASSTLLGKLRSERRSRLKLDAVVAKGGRRDSVQVFANCGVGLVCAVAYAATGQVLFFLAFAVSFAAAAADTWASELGVLNPTRPVSILTLEPLDAGVSGGVSLLGFAASLLGAAFIAVCLLTDLFSPQGGYLRRADGLPIANGGHLEPAAALAFIVAGGFLGSVLDSILGATLQARYRCARTGRVTEKPLSEGLPNSLIRGVRWMTNDAVNFLSILLASASSAGLYALVVGL